MLKLDSCTVLEYIRSSIEILMHMKQEEEKDTSKEGGRSYRFPRDGDNGGGAASEFSSTF